MAGGFQCAPWNGVKLPGWVLGESKRDTWPGGLVEGIFETKPPEVPGGSSCEKLELSS